jgi:regulator of protease activity HflC (stomatin/prohibitin superfamily)
MDKKSELNHDLTKHLQKELAAYGIVVESATLPRTEPDAAIKKAINERSKKAQEIEAAKQELEKQKIEAETKRVKAEAEAKANKIISDSITPELLKQMEMEARLKHGWITIQGTNTVVKD